jgi:hypothetical protein
VKDQHLILEVKFYVEMFSTPEKAEDAVRRMLNHETDVRGYRIVHSIINVGVQDDQVVDSFSNGILLHHDDSVILE